jgi:hypothetical protein
MTTVILTKNDQGKLEGLGERSGRAWAKFRKTMEAMEIGETLSFTFKFPRSPRFHRFHFAMLAALFEAQEQFDDADVFRKWAEVGAGFCRLVPGPNGRMCALPDSIAYERLDDEEFRDVHEKVKAFMQSRRAQQFLYPHLSEQDAAAMIDVVMEGFR